MRCDLHCPKPGGGLAVRIAFVAAALGVAAWVIETLFVALVLAGAASTVALVSAAAITIRSDRKGSISLEDWNRRAITLGGQEAIEVQMSAREITTHHVHHVIYEFPSGSFPVEVAVDTTVIRGELE